MAECEFENIIGVSCLLNIGNRWVIEVQKPEKWLNRTDQAPVIGLGCIGGGIEAGETLLQALQREAQEEINSKIILSSAQKTIDISPAGYNLRSDIFFEGISPVMIWEGAGPGFKPGLKVVVFRGDVEKDPVPGDLPAIILADPKIILEIGANILSVKNLEKHGAEIRSRIDLPIDGRLQLQATLKFVYDLHDTSYGLI